jgi:hypothetical protein
VSAVSLRHRLKMRLTACCSTGTYQTLGGIHGNRADHALADVLGHLQDQAGLPLLHLDLQSVQHTRQLVVELFWWSSDYVSIVTLRFTHGYPSWAAAPSITTNPSTHAI